MMSTASAWNRTDAVRLAAGFVAGALLLGAAWFGSSGETAVADQILWLNLGVLGVFLSGMAAGRWVLRGHQAVCRRAGDFSAWSEPRLGPGAHQMGAANGREEFASGPALTRYHRPTCLVAAGKALSLDSRTAHERAGRRPCEMCRP
jgi:hypothetical protein